jgi:hypothetical protein
MVVCQLSDVDCLRPAAAACTHGCWLLPCQSKPTFEVLSKRAAAREKLSQGEGEGAQGKHGPPSSSTPMINGGQEGVEGGGGERAPLPAADTALQYMVLGDGWMGLGDFERALCHYTAALQQLGGGGGGGGGGAQLGPPGGRRALELRRERARRHLEASQKADEHSQRQRQVRNQRIAKGLRQKSGDSGGGGGGGVADAAMPRAPRSSRSSRRQDSSSSSSSTRSARAVSHSHRLQSSSTGSGNGGVGGSGGSQHAIIPHSQQQQQLQQQPQQQPQQRRHSSKGGSRLARRPAQPKVAVEAFFEHVSSCLLGLPASACLPACLWEDRS